MKKVISVRFKENGKSYYFDPAGADIKTGDYVIVETARGIECGEVVQGVKEIADAAVPKALKPITRMADSVDVRRMRQNREDEKRAYRTCQDCIARHGLEMKLVEAEYTLDRSKIMFYFTADGRVDFRELVKDLAGIFHTRIELRQIGVRDESKMIGGLGICGQPFCCSRFLKPRARHNDGRFLNVHDAAAGRQVHRAARHDDQECDERRQRTEAVRAVAALRRGRGLYLRVHRRGRRHDDAAAFDLRAGL